MSHIYEVEQGDTMVSIAHRYGFRDWRTIYDHPDNAELKETRPNPDVLSPGDQVFIPDKQEQEFMCVTNERHRFTLKALKASFRVVLRDPFGVPFDDVKYVLEVEGETIEGRLSNGELTCEVSPTAREANLTVWPDDANPDYTYQWVLQLGHLNPITTISGAKARLSNLGYPCSIDTDELDESTVEAVKAFQAKYGLSVTGTFDDPTLKKIESLHGV